VKAVWSVIRKYGREHAALLKLLLKYGLGFALLGYVIIDNWTALGNVFRETTFHTAPLMMATLIAAVGLMITFLRWHLLVCAVGLPFSRYNAIRLGLVGYYFNTFLPGSIGGDIIKAFAIAREQSRRTVAVATVLIDRIIGLWALVWFVAIIGSVFWILDDPILANETLKAIILSTIVFCLVSLAIWFAIGFLPDQRATRFADRLENTKSIGASLAAIWRILWAIRIPLLALAIAYVVYSGVLFCQEPESIWNSSRLRTHFIVKMLVGIGCIAVFLGIAAVRKDRAADISAALAANRRIGGSLAELWRACWMYRKQSRAVLIAMLMSLVGHTGWVLVFHYSVQAFEPPNAAMTVGTFPEHMIVVPVGMTVQALIPVPGGIGAGEAAYGKLYHIIDKPEVVGIVGCMSQRVIFFGLGLLGYIVYTRMRSGIERVEEEIKAAEHRPPPAETKPQETVIQPGVVPDT
jgi:hypothetical protein